MKKIKIFIFFSIFSLFLNNCGTVKDAFDPQRKNNSDEFLVEKKLPLSMPPNFEKLPIPNNKKVVDNENEENNLKKLIVKSQNNNSEISSNNIESLGSLEKSLLDKIKNN